MTVERLTRSIKMKALELGFSSVGITTADDFSEYEAEISSREDYKLWTEGRGRLATGACPRSYYPEGKSIICATFGFGDIDYPEELTRYIGRAYLSRAYVPEAHSISGIRVAEFERHINSLGIDIYHGRYQLPCRMACARAGLVTYGKNNFAYSPEHGSFVILYTFLVDAELLYDEPTVERPCPPNCRLCMDACPTHAILEPGRLHPQSCVLYNNTGLTIPPEEIRGALGTHLHGCDVCQAACPRNQKVLKNARRKDKLVEELKDEFDLEKLLVLEEDYYQDVVYPVMYNYIRDLDIFRRNAAIAMGNSGERRYIPALEKALESDNEQVREAAAWALRQLNA